MRRRCHPRRRRRRRRQRRPGGRFIVPPVVTVEPLCRRHRARRDAVVAAGVSDPPRPARSGASAGHVFQMRSPVGSSAKTDGIAVQIEHPSKWCRRRRATALPRLRSRARSIGGAEGKRTPPPRYRGDVVDDRRGTGVRRPQRQRSVPSAASKAWRILRDRQRGGAVDDGGEERVHRFDVPETVRWRSDRLVLAGGRDRRGTSARCRAATELATGEAIARRRSVSSVGPRRGQAVRRRNGVRLSACEVAPASGGSQGEAAPMARVPVSTMDQSRGV